jgi:hypothetical protein
MSIGLSSIHQISFEAARQIQGLLRGGKSMATTAIPLTLTPVLAFLATLIAGVLGHQKLPQWANVVIVGSTIVLLSVICVVATGKLTSNYGLDAIAVVSFTIVLVQAPPFKPLLDVMMRNIPSPVLFLVQQFAQTIATLPMPSPGTDPIDRSASMSGAATTSMPPNNVASVVQPTVNPSDIMTAQTQPLPAIKKAELLQRQSAGAGNGSLNQPPSIPTSSQPV